MGKSKDQPSALARAEPMLAGSQEEWGLSLAQGTADAGTQRDTRRKAGQAAGRQAVTHVLQLWPFERLHAAALHSGVGSLDRSSLHPTGPFPWAAKPASGWRSWQGAGGAVPGAGCGVSRDRALGRGPLATRLLEWAPWDGVQLATGLWGQGATGLWGHQGWERGERERPGSWEEGRGLGGSSGPWVITFAGLLVNVSAAAEARVVSDTLTGLGLHGAERLPKRGSNKTTMA